jgi:hypothetical protein
MREKRDMDGLDFHLVSPVPPVSRRRKQGHSTFLIDLGGGVRSGLTEWCRRELGAVGFEVVHAGFQGGDIRFEGAERWSSWENESRRRARISLNS